MQIDLLQVLLNLVMGDKRCLLDSDEGEKYYVFHASLLRRVDSRKHRTFHICDTRWAHQEHLLYVFESGRVSFRLGKIKRNNFNRVAKSLYKFCGVNIRDTVTNARAHVEEFGVTYPSIFNQDSTIAYTFRVLFIPTTYVLDRRGRVAARIIGAATERSDLESILDEVIAS